MKDYSNINIWNVYNWANDYQGTAVFVDGKQVANSSSEKAAIAYAFGESEVDAVLAQATIEKVKLDE